jgi:hypothetical protein
MCGDAHHQFETRLFYRIVAGMSVAPAAVNADIAQDVVEGLLTRQRSEGAVSSARGAGVEQRRSDAGCVYDDPLVAI